MANTYRMTDRDIKLLVQLRATNAAIFTGRRNSAMRGWRAIRKEMGLHGLMSARQLKKKWDNLKEKYRVLKNPPEGLENLGRPGAWRWFQLMDEAMSGRLKGTASVVQPAPLDEDEDEEPISDLPPLSPPTPREAGPLPGLSSEAEAAPVEWAESVDGVLELREVKAAEGAESQHGDNHVHQSQPTILYATLLSDFSNGNNSNGAAAAPPRTEREAAELDRRRSELQRERAVLEREQVQFDRELIAFERERELLDRDLEALQRDRAAVGKDRTAVDRDRTAVDRDRAAVDRDRAFLDRDQAFLDRDRAFLERDRAFLDRDRAFVERAREDLERERALLRREGEGEGGGGEEVVLQTRLYQNLMMGSDLQTRQRLVSLSQKLVEKL